MKKSQIRLLAGTFLSLGMIAAHSTIAQATAADSLPLFPDGTLSGWTTVGDVTVKNSTVSLNLGSSPFTLTPASGTVMAQITPSGSSATINTIDAALGLANGTMLSATSTGNATINGASATLTTTNYGYLTKSFTLTAGNYTFYWAYAAQDYLPYSDGTFFSLSGNGVNQVNILARNGAAAITSGSQGYPTGTVILQSYGSTTFLSNSFTIATSGTYQLGFGDFNAIDTGVDPILFVSSALGSTTGTAVATSGGTTPPPPASVPDIDTSAGYYTSTQLSQSAVNPTFAGGTLQFVGGGSFTNDFTIQQQGGTIDTNGNDVTLSGSLSGAGSLVKKGSGTLILSGSNGFSGGLYATGGTVQFNAVGAAGTGTIHMVDPTINFNASGAYANNFSLEVASPASADPSIFRNSSGALITLSGAITTGSGTNIDGAAIDPKQYVTFDGGAFLLSNAANNWSGDTVVNSGASLALSGASSIANSARLVDNGTFDISATTSGASITSLAGSGTVTLGSNLLTITNGADTFSGSVNGSGGLAVSGGLQTLSGANTYTGGTTITGGTLALSGNGTLGATAGATLISGGTLDLGATTQTQNGGLTISGGTLQNGTLSSAGTFALQGGTISAVLAGSGSAVQSTGTTTLSGANTYTGGTTITGGTLALSGNGTLGVTSGATLISGGTLDLGATTQTQNGGLTISGGTLQNGTLSSAGTFALQGGTISAVLAGSGSAAQSTGTTTLSGANTYTGGTTITGGTLALSGNGSIASSSGLTDIGTFDISATTNGAAVTSLAGNGAVTLGGQTLTITNGSGSFDGTIAGTGGFTLSGGSLTLTGANSYTGTATINTGASLTASAATIGGSAIIDNGTLTFNQTSDGTLAQAITGSGALVKSGSARLNLTGIANISGTTSVNAGLLSVNGSLTTSALSVGTGATLGGAGVIIGNVSLANGATLAPGNSPGTLTVTGNVGLSSGSLTVMDIDGKTWSAAGGAGSYDRVVASGSFTAAGLLAPRLRGITGAATNSFTPAMGDSFTIVTANTVSGSFAGVTQPTGLAANTRLDVLYGSKTIQLVVTPDSFAALGQANQWNTDTLAAAAALDSVRPAAGSANSPLFSNLYGLNTAGYGVAFAQLSGQIYANALQAFGSMAHASLDAVRDESSQGTSVAARSQGSIELWTRYTHYMDSPKDSARANGYKTRDEGFLVGVTLVNQPKLRFGLAGGYHYSHVNSDLGGNVSGSGGMAYAYATYRPSGIFDLTAVGGFANAGSHVSRDTLTANGVVSASGRARSFAAQASVDARLKAVHSGGFAGYLTGGVELNSTSSSQVNENASNSAFALALPYKSWNSVDGRLGGQATQDIGQIRLSAYANWVFQLADPATASRQVSLAGANWAITSTGVAASGVTYGASFAGKLGNSLTARVSYDGADRGSGYHNDRITAGLALAF